MKKCSLTTIHSLNSEIGVGKETCDALNTARF